MLNCVDDFTEELGMSRHWRWLIFAAVACVSVASVEIASTQGGAQGSPTASLTQLQCDMQEYRAATGLNAVLQGNLLVVSWAGQDGAELRARYGIDGGSPVVRDLAGTQTRGTMGDSR